LSLFPAPSKAAMVNMINLRHCKILALLLRSRYCSDYLITQCCDFSQSMPPARCHLPPATCHPLHIEHCPLYSASLIPSNSCGLHFRKCLNCTCRCIHCSL
jgi:hypothetical protein